MNNDYLHIRCARCGAPRGEHVTGNARANAYCRPVTSEHKDWPRSGATFVVTPGGRMVPRARRLRVQL